MSSVMKAQNKTVGMLLLCGPAILEVRMRREAKEYKNECIAQINQLGQVYGRWEVFSDFIHMLALAISNQVDRTHFDEREKQYFAIIGKYRKEETIAFPKMTAFLIQAISFSSDDPDDILWAMFHEMELHNKWRGQFFTPQYLCDLMAEITTGSESMATEKGYITICEPACGSGAMLLGMAKQVLKQGFSITDNLIAFATDIDIRCVHMAYIQLSLYGIPAVVTHGNSITLEEWSHWYTPAFVRGNWPQRLERDDASETTESEAV